MDMSNDEGLLVYGGRIHSYAFLALKSQEQTNDPDDYLWRFGHNYESNSYKYWYDVCKFSPLAVPALGNKVILVHYWAGESNINEIFYIVNPMDPSTPNNYSIASLELTTKSNMEEN